MVFSKDCEEKGLLGTAYIRKLKNKPIDSWDELKTEAKEMSKAEGMRGHFVGGNKNPWCTMSILFNEKKISKEKKEFITKKWLEKIREDGGGDDLNDYKFQEETSALTKNGTLNFDWFNPVDIMNSSIVKSLDFIICTVAKQKNKTPQDYPNINVLVQSIRADTKRKYYENNVKHGISTFQDNSIELKRRG